jgi:hypothetical protein
MYFTNEDLKQNEKYYDKWLETYFDEYTYCKRGYEIRAGLEKLDRDISDKAALK